MFALPLTAAAGTLLFPRSMPISGTAALTRSLMSKMYIGKRPGKGDGSDVRYRTDTQRSANVWGVWQSQYYVGWHL